MKRYCHIYSLTMADIDQENRMTPMAVLNYFQDSIGRFLAEARVSALDLMEEGATWMITEFHADFANRLPSWPGIVSVEVFLSELSTVKAYVDYLIRDIRGNIVARGTSIWVMIDLATRRMIPCRSCQRFVEQYDDANHTPHGRFAFPSLQPTSEQLVSTHAISDLDTDFNGHMSNRDYFRIAMALAYRHGKGKKRLTAVHIKYLKETHAGDTVLCYRQERNPDRINVLLSHGETGENACQLAAEWQDIMS